MQPTPAEFFRALRRRDLLRADGQTDALRLLDGRGDGATFDGLFIDDFAGRWLVQTSRPGQTPPEWLRPLVGGSGPNAPRSIYWKQLDSRGEHQQPPLHWAGETEALFTVRENGLSYHIDFGGGYSQGIFLDQRDNRAEVRRRINKAGDAVLNCFSYTCAFSVAAAAAGACTTSIDLSRRSLNWGRENFRLNDLSADDPGKHWFCAGDVFDFLRRFNRQGQRFRGVVLDPPTFSRDRKGKVFRVGNDFGELVRLVVPLLEPGGWLLCSTNSQGMTTDGFRRMVLAALPDERRWHLETPPLPSDFTSAHALQVVWCSLSST